MTIFFADTSFFVAFLNPGDVHHDAAAEYIESFEGTILTTQWVLAELGNYLCKEHTRKLFAAFVRELAADKLFHVEEANDEYFQLALELYDHRPDKEWSFVDCTSFMMMRRRSITTALSADHHFEQAGYVILLK
jgi:uncharacterized protein